MTEELLELNPVLDVYADGVADVELLGDNVRLIFFSWQGGQRVVVAKIVRPRCSVQGMLPTLIAAKSKISQLPPPVMRQ